jgi:hypothetical protein
MNSASTVMMHNCLRRANHHRTVVIGEYSLRCPSQISVDLSQGCVAMSRRSPSVIVFTIVAFSVRLVVAQEANDYSTGVPTPADWQQLVTPSVPGSEIELTQFGGIGPAMPRSVLESLQNAPTRGSRANRATELVFARAPLTARRRRLSRVPDMLGDTFLPSAQLAVSEAVNGSNGMFVFTPLLNSAGSERTKVGENNKALPVDRFYVNYNHFNNVVRRDAVIDIMNVFTGARQAVNADRFVLGIERTLFGGNTSVELRLPMSVIEDVRIQDLGGPPGANVATDSGTLGNMSVIGKHLVIDEPNWHVSAGIGFNVPTGDDGRVIVNESIYTLANQAVFFQPFVALSAENGDAFLHSFLQFDVPLNSNGFSVDDTTGMSPLGKVGEIRSQTLVHWDITVGRWLMRRKDSNWLSGLAALAEFHLTAAVDEADGISGFRPTLVGNSLFAVQASPGQFTATYITTGLHAELSGDWTLRTAAVLPLQTGRDRFFDAELLVQLGRRY